MRTFNGRICLAAFVAALASLFPMRAAWAAKGQLVVRATDEATGEPVACRMHLKNAKGKPVFPAGAVKWHDHFVFDGEITLELPRGRYTFEIERGPEYRSYTGHFEIESFANDTKDVEMKRLVDMSEEAWWSGDLHIHRPPQDIEILMRAEDLHVAPVITWWNKKNLQREPGFPAVKRGTFDGNRIFDFTAGEDERQGGALLYFRLDAPLEISKAEKEHPSPADFLLEARQQPQAWIDVEKPFWWDAPTWVATGRIDSIGLANNHQCRDSMYDNEAWGKARDKKRFGGVHGNALWSQHIYFQMLNCGLRIPPSAGSASGVLPNPVGYNRVYVYLEKQPLDYDAWWEGLRSGRVLVTNGPMLRAFANGQPPGHVFTADEGESLTIELVGSMDWAEKIEYIEIIRDGKVAHSVRIDDWAENEGKLPPLTFTESGWFMVRAATENPKTYRFAATGPWYVEFANAPRRISRESAAFFSAWVEERMGTIELTDEAQRREVLQHHERARDFWRGLESQANAP